MKKVIINSEYIALGQFLKFAQIITNGGEAKSFLSTEKVIVNGEDENRRGRKLYPGYVVKIKNIEYLVDK